MGAYYISKAAQALIDDLKKLDGLKQKELDAAETRINQKYDKLRKEKVSKITDGIVKVSVPPIALAYLCSDEAETVKQDDFSEHNDPRNDGPASQFDIKFKFHAKGTPLSQKIFDVVMG